MTTLAFPLDLESRSEFRRTAVATGLPPAVLVFVLWRLFRELAYEAQAGGRPGVLTHEVATRLTAELQEHHPGIHIKDLAGFLNDGEMHGVEGGWMIPLFAMLNRSQLGKDTIQHKGQRVKHTLQRIEREHASLVHDLLLLPPETFSRPDGQVMTAQEQQRAMMLIRACDAALDLPERPPHGFTSGLVQDAWEVCAVMSNEQIDGVIRHISKNRVHPFLAGMVTERLLVASEPGGPLGSSRLFLVVTRKV